MGNQAGEILIARFKWPDGSAQRLCHIGPVFEQRCFVKHHAQSRACLYIGENGVGIVVVEQCDLVFACTRGNTQVLIIREAIRGCGVGGNRKVDIAGSRGFQQIRVAAVVPDGNGMRFGGRSADGGECDLLTWGEVRDAVGARSHGLIGVVDICRAVVYDAETPRERTR